MRVPTSCVLAGTAALVSGRAAFVMRRDARKHLERARLDGDNELVAAFTALLEASNAYTAERFESRGTPTERRGSIDDGPTRMIDLMSVADVATSIARSERSVRALAARGTLRGVRSPKGWRFGPADVDAYLAERDR